MPKRKEPELTPAEQFKRFRETAKRHELDESGKDLEDAFAHVAKRPAPSSTHQDRKKSQK
jgi:hypothetical protein